MFDKEVIARLESDFDMDLKECTEVKLSRI